MMASTGSDGTIAPGRAARGGGPGWVPRGGGRRHRQRAGACWMAVSLAVGLAACSSGSPTGSASAAGSQRPTSPALSCAWPYLVSVQVSNNAVILDSAAAYWVQPVVARTNTRIVVSGHYPDARYASLSVYTPAGNLLAVNGVGSSLTDYRIAPEPGSVNPWQQPAAADGRFVVTVRSDVSAGQVNTLPLPSGTTSRHPGYLIYRVYLPAGGSFSRVQLPQVTLQQDGDERTLPACPSHNARVPVPVPASRQAADRSGAAAPEPLELEFFKPAQSTYGGLFPNADTAYVLAYLVRPPASDVVVVTGKAPTFAPGSQPSPWPARGEDVRYWSMCIGAGVRYLPTVVNRLAGGGTDYGCRADQATALNAAGDYTYVIGAESQRAAIERIPGVTFLPFSTSEATKLYFLLLRNMLVSSEFTNWVENVTQANDPAAAAAAMGAYYPRASVCPLATLAAKGAAACGHPR
jgi:hypothetical protein